MMVVKYVYDVFGNAPTIFFIPLCRVTVSMPVLNFAALACRQSLCDNNRYVTLLMYLLYLHGPRWIANQKAVVAVERSIGIVNLVPFCCDFSV